MKKTALKLTNFGLEENYFHVTFFATDSSLYAMKQAFDRSFDIQHSLKKRPILDEREIDFEGLFRPIVNGVCLSSARTKLIPGEIEGDYKRNLTAFDKSKRKGEEEKIITNVWVGKNKDIQVPFLEDEYCLQSMLKW